MGQRASSSRDSRRILAASDDRSLKIVGPEDGSFLSSVGDIGEAPKYPVQLSDDLVAVSTRGSGVVFYSLQKCKRSLTLPSSPRAAICFDPSKSILFRGSSQWDIMLCSVPDGKELGKLVKHISWLNSICVIPSVDGAVFSCSSDRYICKWDIETCSLEAERLDNAQVRSLSFDNERRMLFSGGDDQYGNGISDAIFWDAKSMAEVTRIPMGRKINSLVFRPVQSQLVVGTSGKVTIYDVRRPTEPIAQFVADKRGGLLLSDCPEDGIFLTTSFGHSLRAWRDTGKMAWKYVGPKELNGTSVFYVPFEERYYGSDGGCSETPREESAIEERLEFVKAKCRGSRLEVVSGKEVPIWMFAWFVVS